MKPKIKLNPFNLLLTSKNRIINYCLTCYTAGRTSAPTLRQQLWEPWSASRRPYAYGGTPWRSPAPRGIPPLDTVARWPEPEPGLGPGRRRRRIEASPSSRRPAPMARWRPRSSASFRASSTSGGGPGGNGSLDLRRRGRRRHGAFGARERGRTWARSGWRPRRWSSQCQWPNPSPGGRN